MKRRFSAMIGVFLSVLFIWMAFRKADFTAMRQIFSSARPVFIFPVLLTVGAELYLRAIKWKMLLSASSKVKTGDTLRLETASLALNNILPFRLGDISRGFIGAEMFKLSSLTVFSTVLAEKILDVIALVFIALLASRTARLITPTEFEILLLLLTLAIVSFAVFFFYRASKSFNIKVSGLFETFPGVKKTLKKILNGFKSFSSPASAFYIIFLSVLQWFINALGYYFVALGFGLGNLVSISKSLVLCFAGATASSVPGAPGSFGAVELTLSAVMSSWGADKEAGLAFALAAHILPYLIITVSGVFFLYGTGYSLSSVYRLSAKKNI